jgi:hypothetical protein
MSNGDADIDDHGDADNEEAEVTSHCHSSGENSRFLIVNSVIKSADTSTMPLRSGDQQKHCICFNVQGSG